MASAAKDSSTTARIVFSIPPADIEVCERIGLFWPAKAEAIGALMARDGQNDPIKVRKNGPRAAFPWRLVVGHHRLEGARLAGLNAIDAIQLFGTDEELRAIEASENIHRRSFAPIERACFVRAIADAAERQMRDQHDGLTQQQIAVRKRWEAVRDRRHIDSLDPDKVLEIEAENTGANLAVVYGWSAHVADALGLSERAVFRDLALHRGLIAPFPDLYADLAKHPIVGENASALREIIAIRDEVKRRLLIEELVQYPALTVADAKVRIGIEGARPASAEGATKFMNNAGANIARLSLEQQRSWAPELASALKPQALRTVRDALNARLIAEGIEKAPVQKSETPSGPTPAVSIRQSVKPDYIVCLEDGTRHQRLRPYIARIGMTPDQYRARWKLPNDYPMTAPNVSADRHAHLLQLVRRLAIARGAVK